MKTQETRLLALMFLLLTVGLYSQEKKSQAYWIHEDVVMPSMVSEYENICKDLTSNMKKFNIQELNVIVTNLSDHRYLWVSPINAMADIEKPVFKTLSEKMGPEKMEALFNKMDKCYDIEHDYVIHLDKELSYMPDGITQTPVGKNYRKFHYFHYAPGSGKEVHEKIKAIRALFESKGSKLDYRVYRSGFGTRGEFFMVAIAAEDAVDYAKQIAQNNELLGEEWQKTWGDFQSSLLQYDIMEGQMRPDMAYSPSN